MNRPLADLCVALVLLAPLTAAAGPACPAGTQPTKQVVGPETIEMCIDAAKMIHGKVTRRDAAGVLVGEDEWDHGTKTGLWREWYGPGHPRSETTWIKGQRQGPYGEWMASGRRVLWGWFEKDHEEGPWLMASKDDATKLIFIVFDAGADITERLDPPPRSCADWSGRTLSFRRGLLATTALQAAQSLRGDARRNVTDWTKLGLCLQAGATVAEREVAAACTASKANLDQIAPNAASALAERCIRGK